jgi:hypothetical protein
VADPPIGKAVLATALLFLGWFFFWLMVGLYAALDPLSR